MHGQLIHGQFIHGQFIHGQFIHGQFIHGQFRMLQLSCSSSKVFYFIATSNFLMLISLQSNVPKVYKWLKKIDTVKRQFCNL